MGNSNLSPVPVIMTSEHGHCQHERFSTIPIILIGPWRLLLLAFDNSQTVRNIDASAGRLAKNL